MRTTTPRTALKRLGALEQQRGRNKRLKRNVALWPRLVSVDDWEEISVPQQTRLKVNVKEDGKVDYSGIAEFEFEVSCVLELGFDAVIKGRRR